MPPSAETIQSMAETHNLTVYSSGENLTEPPLDAASCLFLSILPYGQAVPALVCVFVLLTLFSFLANLLTLVALARSEELSWQPRFTFLKNLILSDLMQTATFGPTVIHSLVQRRTMPFGTWCYVQFFIGSASIFNSLFATIVCRAIHYLVIVTETRLRRVLTLIWISSITISVVSMVLLHTGEAQSSGSVTMGLLCEPNMMEQHMGSPRASVIFRKVMSHGMLVLCLLVLLFSSNWMDRDPSNAVIPFNKNARKTVLFDCCMFLMELLPVLLQVISVTLWEVRGPAAMTGRSSQVGDVCMLKPAPTATAAVLHVSLLMMLMVPPCVNTLVYWLRNVEERGGAPGAAQPVPLGDGGGAGLVERVEDAAHQNRAQTAV